MALILANNSLIFHWEVKKVSEINIVSLINTQIKETYNATKWSQKTTKECNNRTQENQFQCHTLRKDRKNESSNLCVRIWIVNSTTIWLP
jgi:hypothetical protein